VQIFGYITITQDCFTNQTLTYIYFFISCSNETNENSFLIFSKVLHIYNKETYKIPNHLKENTFKFHHLITTHKIFLHEKIWFDKLQYFFNAREFMENIIKRKKFKIIINDKIGINIKL
jgi:hypothetical protein